MTLISESEYSSLQHVANTIRAERDALLEQVGLINADRDELIAERDEIIEALDTYGWWMDNPNMLERLKFALATSQEKSDELANMQLATRSTRQAK